MNLTAILPRFALAAAAVRPVTPHAARAQPRPQALLRHATLALPNRGLRLQVLQGCVWITRDGCPADWVLEAGQHFDHRPGAPVLVHALQDTQLVLAAAAGATQNAR